MLRPTRLLSLAACMALVPLGTASAQFWDRLTNPQIPTEIHHPPNLGIQVNKIAFGMATGRGSREFSASLSERFVRANVDVLEREELDTVLSEHHFNRTAYADPYTSPEMGRILGPSVMIFVSMLRYTTEQKQLYRDWTDSKKYVHRTWISQTRAYAKVSVRAVDLATSRRFAQQVFESNPVFENKAEDRCCADYPDDLRALDAAMNDIVEQAARLFLPWTEVVPLYFFDDGDCNLKLAFNRLKAGDVRGALDTSLDNIEGCKLSPKRNDKVMAHAYHNVGMSYFAMSDYPRALRYLEEAARIKPGGIIDEAIATCRRAQDTADEAQRVEDQAEAAAAAAERRTAADQASTTSETMTNRDVLALLGAKLPPTVIIAKIKNSPCRFDTGTDALIALSKAGATPEIITAMMECRK